MHSRKNLSKYLHYVCPFMHETRRESLESVLDSCLRNEQLSVTSLGRGINSEAYEKHNIKRADRLLSNGHLQRELPQVYKSLSSVVLQGLEGVVILVDWSNLDSRDEHFLLRASVALKGRPITIYEEVHSGRTKEKRATHERFLKNLRQVIPRELKVVIVTDAGFRITWFKEVEKHNWDWVGRIRGRMKVDLADDSRWIEGRSLFPQATNHAKAFNDAVIGKKNNLKSRLVLFKANPKGRTLLTKRGKKRKGIRSKRSAAAQREPWLLATSLPATEFDAENIVNIYRLRMQIEESFRDMKSPLYGIGLKNSRTYKKARLAVLVAVATLANTFAWVLGKAVQNKNEHFHFQANSIKKTPVLSFVFIGLKAFKKRKCFIHFHHFKNAWNDVTTFAYNAYIS